MDDSGTALPPPTTRSSFTIWAHDKLRYSDCDPQGHVNNAVFATYFETGRVSFLHENRAALMVSGCEFVVVHLTIDYIAELHYPGQVDIGTRVLAVGNSSFRVDQGAFSAETCVATSQTVIVQLNQQSRRAEPLTPAMRHWLGERIAGAGR